MSYTSGGVAVAMQTSLSQISQNQLQHADAHYMESFQVERVERDQWLYGFDPEQHERVDEESNPEKPPVDVISKNWGPEELSCDTPSDDDDPLLLELMEKFYAATKQEVANKRDEVGRPGLGQIYYAFQESVLIWVFSHFHGSYIPFFDLMGMEEAMSSNGCVSRFGSLEAKEKAIEKWKSMQEVLGWKQPQDMELLKSLQQLEDGYDLPRLSPAQFKKALEDINAASVEDINAASGSGDDTTGECFDKEQLETLKRFVEMYCIVEKQGDPPEPACCSSGH